jgi:flagellar hook-associated protein 1 FlgK
MADIFNTAVTGLVAFQNALAVTSNNITNANTPGYSVESPNFVEAGSNDVGGITVGNGVNVTGVTRSFNQFAVNQLWTANSGLGQQTAYVNLANQVDNAIGSSTNGVSAALSAFFNSWQTLSTDPTSTTDRQQVISQAQTLAGSITSTATTLNQLTGNVNTQIQGTVTSVNSLATQIAQLNQSIQAQTADNAGQPPNDLLDQRDQLITQLSSLANVNTTTESNGSIDVFIGSGQPLVLGGNASKLGTIPNPYNATELDVTLSQGPTAQNITSSVNGGQLGGLLQVQSQVIEPALNSLGQIATGLAVSVNSQQAQGLDLNGNLGQALFSVAPPQVDGAATNTGTATITASPVTSATIGQLTTDNYTLNYTAAGWTAQDQTTGQTVTVQGAGTAASPLSFAGLSLVVSGAPAVGDSFAVEPTAAAASSLTVSLTDPAGIAAASPLQSSAALGNTSSATLGAPQALNVADPTLLLPATITFVTPTTYTVTTQTAAGAVTSPVQTLAANGVITEPAIAGLTTGGAWNTTLSGTPAAGDSFSIGPNGTGDDGNALAMSALQNDGVLSSGTVSLTAGYAALVGTVGTQTQQATNAQSAQQAIATQAQQTVSNISGVNLDEEASNMLQWQNAYTAAAKVVTTAETLFQTLITAIQDG